MSNNQKLQQLQPKKEDDYFSITIFISGNEGQTIKYPLSLVQHASILVTSQIFALQQAETENDSQK